MSGNEVQAETMQDGVARRLKEIRRLCGLTQAAMGSASGVGAQQWGQWEMGRISPGMGSLQVIGESLGMDNRTVGWLVMGGDNDLPAQCSPHFKLALERVRDEATTLLEGLGE